jgi:LCP family protein required for cell wall assembly
MPIPNRRLVVSAVLLLSLIVTATFLRLAMEWRQALSDIDSMIVTPVALILPTEVAVGVSDIADDSVFDPASQPVGAVAEAPAILPTSNIAADPDVTPIPTPEIRQEVLNILLLGTDARKDDVNPPRTDALVLVRLSRDTGRVSMLSIPRDLWVNYPGGGEGRINAAYAIGETRYGEGGGAALAKSTVGRLLGLRVDHFVLINFQGFETLIDRLDGISIDVPASIYDPAYPTDDYNTISVRFTEGLQRMDGERALIYARTRHADSDFGRNQRQQLVLVAIFDRIRERGLLQQLTSLDDYTGALRGYVQTDIPRGTMLALANYARDVSVDDVLRYAIDSSAIVDLRDPATFGVDPSELKRIVGQFSGEAISTAGGE